MDAVEKDSPGAFPSFLRGGIHSRFPTDNSRHAPHHVVLRTLRVGLLDGLDTAHGGSGRWGTTGGGCSSARVKRAFFGCEPFGVKTESRNPNFLFSRGGLPSMWDGCRATKQSLRSQSATLIQAFRILSVGFRICFKPAPARRSEVKNRSANAEDNHLSHHHF